MIANVPCTFVLLLIALASLQAGCSRGEDRHNTAPPATKLEKKYIQTLTKPNQEAVALLAAKYDMRVETVERFFDSYLSDTSSSYLLLKSAVADKDDDKAKADNMDLVALEKEKYYQALVRASDLVGIAVKTGAQLVSDYKTFLKQDSGGS